jgi:outer membrane lipoprotein-sorting protein
MLRFQLMRRAIILGLLTLLPGIALGQAEPNPAEILKKISDAYAAAQYELAGTQTSKALAGGAPAQVHFRVAFKGPNQYRLEGSFAGIASDDPNMEEAVIVHDGSALWFYYPKANIYGSIPADQVAADPEGSAHTPKATDEVTMRKYRVAKDFIGGARFLREDEIEFDGAKVSCYVLSIPEKSPGPYTWWVEKTSYRVLREVTDDGSTDYTTIKLGSAPDSLFRFEPPPGARKVVLNLP